MHHGEALVEEVWMLQKLVTPPLIVINTSPGSGVSLIVDSINVIGYKI
jgi:hypothetical protein